MCLGTTVTRLPTVAFGFLMRLYRGVLAGRLPEGGLMPEEGLASRATTHEGRRIGIGSEMFRRTVCKACYVAVFATSGLVFVCVRQTASMV